MSRTLPFSKNVPFQTQPALPTDPTMPQSSFEGQTPRRRHGLLAQLLRLVFGQKMLALADQAVVSGMSFATTVIIGRYSLPSELGLYSLGTSVLLSTLAVQETLISTPYMIQRHSPVGTPEEDAGSSLAHCGLLSVLTSIVLGLSALFLLEVSATPALTAMIWSLSVVMPFMLLREFGRQLSYSHLRVVQVLILDVAVAALLFTGLGWLAWAKLMSSTHAFAALGIACGLTSGAWLYLSRASFAIRSNQIRLKLKQSWKLGSWLFAGHCALALQGLVIYWLLAWIAGTAAPGIFAACMSIVSCSNLLVIGLGNVLAPRAVLASKRGLAALLRQSILDALLLGIAMTVFCLIILFAGEDLMRLLFHGSEYAGQGHAMVVLALALLAQAVGGPAANALGALERPKELCFTTVLAVVVTVIGIWSLTLEWELVGAAYGFLAGTTAGAIGRWAAFLALVPWRVKR